MNMLALSVRNVNQNRNITSGYMSVWVTNALDGSDDYQTESFRWWETRCVDFAVKCSRNLARRL